MTPQVKRTRLATHDLTEITYYIGEQNQSPAAAMRWLDLIEQRSAVYASQPEMGEGCPEIGPDVRRFTVGNYFALYRPAADGIELLRVIHGSRDRRADWLAE